MSTLSPKAAAILARDIYLIQNPAMSNLLFSNPVFRTSSDNQGAQAKTTKTLTSEVGGRIILNTKDNFGACALGGDKHPNDLFLLFRGTTTANKRADWLTDARIGISLSGSGIPVHSGFNHSFSSMLPEIKRFLGEHSQSVQNIHCVGHSLGGAVATLAADWAVRNTSNKVSLYTFGQPRVGTSIFSNSITKKVGSENIYRAYHRTDPVPMVPLYPYMHAPYKDHGFFLPSNQPLASGEAHKMSNYVESVKGKSWEQLKTIVREPYSIEKSIENWLKSKSPVNPQSSAFWRWLDSALIYVLKKVAITALAGIQGALITGFTLADKLAYILAKGINLAENISIWVELLIRKMAAAIGINVKHKRKDITKSFIRRILIQLTELATKTAQKAIQAINS
jgi:hypothetical protein